MYIASSGSEKVDRIKFSSQRGNQTPHREDRGNSVAGRVSVSANAHKLSSTASVGNSIDHHRTQKKEGCVTHGWLRSRHGPDGARVHTGYA